MQTTTVPFNDALPIVRAVHQQSRCPVLTPPALEVATTALYEEDDGGKRSKKMKPREEEEGGHAEAEHPLLARMIQVIDDLSFTQMKLGSTGEYCSVLLYVCE